MNPTQKKKVTIGKLLSTAFIWALAVGVGIFLTLFLLAAWMGKTDVAYEAAYLMGPASFLLMFLGVLFFQVPRAMALKKGAFAIYLAFLTVPVLVLGGALLWWFFR